jgi:hypothetical protein
VDVIVNVWYTPKDQRDYLDIYIMDVKKIAIALDQQINNMSQMVDGWWLMVMFELWIRVHVADFDKNIPLHVYNRVEQYALAIE